MYPRDVMHVWPVPDYEITGKNPWSRAFQRWAPLYVLLAACAYISYYRRSDGHAWPFDGPYQLVGVFFLMIHGATLGALLDLRRIPRRWHPEAVDEVSPEVIRTRLCELGELPEPRWRATLLTALERCTHDGICRSLESELTTRNALSRQQNDALDLSTQLVLTGAAEPLNRALEVTFLTPMVVGLAGGILLQFPWEPVGHWHIGIVACVILLWCLGIALCSTLLRGVSRRAVQRSSSDLWVARALDQPRILVEALRHMETAAWEREDGPAYFSAQYWRDRREKLEAALLEEPNKER